MGAHTDRTIARIAEPQFGNFTFAQARAAGVTPSELKWRVSTGRLEHPYNSLYRVAGTPRSWRGDLLAACYAGGARAVASHRSAAALWALAGGRTDIVEITCPRWRRSRYEGLYVHESRALSTSHIAAVDGIPVTNPALTLLMLGAVCRPLVVEQALDSALRRELVTHEAVRALLWRLGRQGRNGSGVLRALLSERDPDRAPCESEKETELYRLLAKHGLPLPVPQYQILHNGRFIARPDFAYIDARLSLEYQSYQEHSGKLALDRDTARRNALIKIGWTELGITHAEIRAGGHTICAQIDGHLRSAGCR